MLTSRKKPKVFICYMKRDVAKAEELFEYLSVAGADPWLDTQSLNLGDVWEDEIKKAVSESDAFVVCLRPEFDTIGFRQKEIRLALETLQMRPSETGFIIPFIIEPCELPIWSKRFHAGAHHSDPSTLKDLIAAVNKHCNANLVESIREIKYILGKRHYIRLKNYLYDNADNIKITEQWNFYFYDECEVIISEKAMVRLRVESVLEQESLSHLDRILFTIKTNAVPRPDGTEIRPEKNYDLTEDFADLMSESMNVSR